MGDYEACFWRESKGKESGKEGQREGRLQTYERKGGRRKDKWGGGVKGKQGGKNAGPAVLNTWLCKPLWRSVWSWGACSFSHAGSLSPPFLFFFTSLKHTCFHPLGCVFVCGFFGGGGGLYSFLPPVPWQECKHSRTCVLRKLWKEWKEGLWDVLRSLSIAGRVLPLKPVSFIHFLLVTSTNNRKHHVRFQHRSGHKSKQWKSPPCFKDFCTNACFMLVVVGTDRAREETHWTPATWARLPPSAAPMTARFPAMLWLTMPCLWLTAACKLTSSKRVCVLWTS